MRSSRAGISHVRELLKLCLRNFYGRYGDLIKQYEVHIFQMLHDIPKHDHMMWNPPLFKHYKTRDLFTEVDLITNFDLITKFRQVSKEHMQLANRGRLLLQTPGPVPFGSCMCSNVEICLLSLSCIQTLNFEHY